MAITRRIGAVVLSAAVTQTGTISSGLRRIVGMMQADVNMTHPATFAIAFSNALDLARQCNATLASLDRVRKVVLEEKPTSAPATLHVSAIVRLTLACEARIIAVMDFRSRDEVDAVAEAVNRVFAQAEEVASDDLDAGGYMAIVKLHGDLVQHLAARGRQMPRVVSYHFQTVFPAYRMAQRAYADASRAIELIKENGVVHPAFMPRDGKMLAV